MQLAPHPMKIVSGWGSTATCAYCHGFAKIKPLVRGSDGYMHMNPDFEMIRRFHMRAEPYGFLLAAGATQEFVFTVPAEEESLGDMLINELLAVFTPDTVRNISVQFLSLQTDRTFQNAPVFNTLVFGNSHLNCCLPCCTLVQATNSLKMSVTNNEVFPVEIRVVARGIRFLPKSDELRTRMLMYWNTIPSYPYFQTLDQQEVIVPGGGTPFQVTALMTIQGTGDFEVKWPRAEIIDVGPPADPNLVLVSVVEQVGREWQTDPIPLTSFVATPTLIVPGFPGDLFRAASACHCPPYPQLFKRNNRIRHIFTNNNPVGVDVRVRLTYAGCFHEVDECKPGRSMDRIRSLEPTIGPVLVTQRDMCPPHPEGYAPEQEYYNDLPFQPAIPPPMPAAQPMPMRVQAPARQGLRFVQQAPLPGSQRIAAYPQAQPPPNPVGPPGLGGMVKRGDLYWDPFAKAWKRA